MLAVAIGHRRVTLTLFIRNDEVGPEVQREFVLREVGGIIGRAAVADWRLPDPDNYISSRHCEIRFRRNHYILADVSTNGTFLNGASGRMARDHKLRHGDFFRIGHYEIVANLSDRAMQEDAAAGPGSAIGWSSWQGRPSEADQATDRPTPPPRQAAKRPAPAAREADPVWDKLESDNRIDWQASGFNPAPLPAPPSPAPVSAPSPTSAPASAARTPSGLSNDDQVEAFLAVLGLERQDVPVASTATLLRSAKLLKRLVAGLMVMVKARARAKAEMGAESTIFDADGNNPFKFAQSTEQALAQLISPPQRGFLDGERAIEEAFFDLQSHQMAMLRGMQGALQSTLARFSPEAIRKRAEKKGILAKIVPAARDAALWQNYEREFGGVAESADAAFIEMFAEEFRKAYEEQARKGSKG